MEFLIFHQFVRRVGKKSRELAEESVDVTGTNFLDKFLNLKRRFYFVCIGIKRQEILDKSFFFFPIWKSEGVDTKLTVIPFDRQITALVNNGNGIG